MAFADSVQLDEEQSEFRIEADLGPGLSPDALIDYFKASISTVEFAISMFDRVDDHLHYFNPSGLTVVRFSYQNPFVEVLSALIGAAQAEKVAKFIQTISTIGLERAERKEKLSRERLDNVVRELTIENDIDDRIGESVKRELENEALRLANTRARFELAKDMVEAQRRMRAEDPSVKVWNLDYLFAILGPRADSDDSLASEIELFRIFQPTVTRVDGEIPPNKSEEN